MNQYAVTPKNISKKNISDGFGTMPTKDFQKKTFVKYYILCVKGNNKELAICEFETLFRTYYNERVELRVIGNTYLIFETKNKIEDQDFLNRLTYTNEIFEYILEENSIEKLKLKLELLDLSKYDNQSFLLRIKKTKSTNQNLNLDEKQIATIIHSKLKNPKVDMKNPDNYFNVIVNSDADKLYFTRQIFENKKTYQKRMPKLRPIVKPYTLKSDMARAGVNLLGIKDGVVLDPFCGIGGILLEAYDMKFDIIGNDISWNDLRDMKINFDYYFPKSDFIRTLADSRTQFLKDNTIDGIVTDIPYGKCSRRFGEDLYGKFLESAKKYLKPNKRLVIIYANFTQFRDIALKYFSEVCEIEEYINKSMTRHILVLENSK